MRLMIFLIKLPDILDLYQINNKGNQLFNFILNKTQLNHRIWIDDYRDKLL